LVTDADSPTGFSRSTGDNNARDDALGGKIYYLARAEMEIPLGSGAREMGLRPSIFVDAGAVAGLRDPVTTPFGGYCSLTPVTGTNNPALPAVRTNGNRLGDCTNVAPSGYTAAYLDGTGFEEVYLGDTLKPRVSVGFGVNWNSPFGPFRIDIAKALLKEPGDDTQLISFNVGTQF
ncbi:MAG TPA: BamA/TamA family outer membrane protein, partial [Sphingobium sp.]|nr:BamA/TamA family outer membrane protein [Sphingobium sp.]